MNLNKNRKYSPEEIECNFKTDFSKPVREWSRAQLNAFKAIVEIAYLNHLHSNRPVAYGKNRLVERSKKSGYYYFIHSIMPVIQGNSYTHRLSTYFTLDKLIQICKMTDEHWTNKNRLLEMTFVHLKEIAGNHPTEPFKKLIAFHLINDEQRRDQEANPGKTRARNASEFVVAERRSPESKGNHEEDLCF